MSRKKYAWIILIAVVIQCVLIVWGIAKINSSSEFNNESRTIIDGSMIINEKATRIYETDEVLIEYFWIGAINTEGKAELFDPALVTEKAIIPLKEWNRIRNIDYNERMRYILDVEEP